MHEVCVEAAQFMEAGFRRLENQVQKPVETLVQGQPALRYAEQTIHQAMLLKLARYISGLNAIHVLLKAGFVQEQAVIQRTLDEIGEDIVFLGLAPDNPPNLYREYLERFWQEEFEENVEVINSNKPRYQISRKKITEYIMKHGGKLPAEGEKSIGIIRQAYSGYVHAAAPQIMEMCGGIYLKFYVSGLLGTFRIIEHADDALNYHYRGLLSVAVVGKSFGDASLVDAVYRYLERFEKVWGTTFMAEVREAKKDG